MARLIHTRGSMELSGYLSEFHDQWVKRDVGFGSFVFKRFQVFRVFEGGCRMADFSNAMTRGLGLVNSLMDEISWLLFEIL